MRAKGFRDIAVGVKREATNDNMSVIAAGVAYYGFLAIFPALAALILIYGLFANPHAIQHQLASLSGIPSGVRDMLGKQLTTLARHSSGSLSLGVAASILIALWSSTKGTKALIDTLNIAYDEPERRGFFRRTAITLLFTIGIILFAVTAMALVAVFPAAIHHIGLPPTVARLLALARWPVLAAMVLFGLALLYHYGPSHDHRHRRWLTWGSVVATAVWLAASAGFSFYVSRFGNYNKTYGSVAAIVILLTWFLLSAYVVILGAELNGQLERRTAKDTTAGRVEPRDRPEARFPKTAGETP
jgi:membrane protein